jgi:hypothetical protein
MSMRKNDVANFDGDPIHMYGLWYDWFCSDKGLALRNKKYLTIGQLLIAKTKHLFENPSCFLKQNPGWHGDWDTDTTLIQLYEDGYPPNSLRICLSLSHYTKGKGYRKEHQYKYELNIWREDPGPGYPDTPCLSATTLPGMKAKLQQTDFCRTFISQLLNNSVDTADNL